MGNTQTIWVGDIAPDFTLKDHHNREFKLSALAGKKVLLSFHPLAWTPVCADQMKALEPTVVSFAARCPHESTALNFLLEAWDKKGRT